MYNGDTFLLLQIPLLTMCISDLHEDDVMLAKNFPMLAQFTLYIFMID